jgi:hypothetical protein
MIEVESSGILLSLRNITARGHVTETLRRAFVPTRILRTSPLHVEDALGLVDIVQSCTFVHSLTLGQWNFRFGFRKQDM